jgi:hypothetical protein
MHRIVLLLVRLSLRFSAQLQLSQVCVLYKSSILDAPGTPSRVDT